MSQKHTELLFSLGATTYEERAREVCGLKIGDCRVLRLGALVDLGGEVRRTEGKVRCWRQTWVDVERNFGSGRVIRSALARSAKAHRGRETK